MRNFNNILVNGHQRTFDFECYEHTEKINIGDKYLFFFADTISVFTCTCDAEVDDVNTNDRNNINEKCFKIKNTDFVLN